MSDINPRWLKLNQAAEYSSIGQKRLMALAREGRIKGCQDPDSGRHDWIFDRLSIDEYREGQESEMSARDKALEILQSIYGA